MRVANHRGRAVLVKGNSYFDLARSTDNYFDHDVMGVLHRWGELGERSNEILAGEPDGTLDIVDLGPCVPRPRNVLAIGMNYADHAIESGMTVPKEPSVFTKFPSCLTGPGSDIRLSSDTVDYEVELVLVVGKHSKNVREDDALSYLAGVTIGQDISDRDLQLSGSPPQFSLGKSIDTFGPIGPTIVSLDELDDVEDLGIWCEVDGVRLQQSRTSELIFSPAELLAYLSSHITLSPGDLIFTGTPPGVGIGFNPPKYLSDGAVIVSGIDGLGTMRNMCRNAQPHSLRYLHELIHPR